MSMDTIIISDIHISAGPLDDFDNELECCFVDFLEKNLTVHGATELVINGDLLDFVQAPPWEGPELRSKSNTGVPLCFTETQSLAKLDAIANAHPLTFTALRNFLSSNKENIISILPGNHDADFFWPSVQERFAYLVDQRISSNSQLHFHLQKKYMPIQAPTVWIEHGHQHDPCNWFAVDLEERWAIETPPIFQDEQGRPRLLECVGTQFLIRFLNKLDEDYPFVDNVKPFSKFLKIFATSALHPSYGSLKVAAAIWSLLRFLSSTAKDNPADLLFPFPGVDHGLVNPLKTYVGLMSPDDQEALRKFIEEGGIIIGAQPLDSFLSRKENADKCMSYLGERLAELPTFYHNNSMLLSAKGEPDTLSLVKAFLRDESMTLINVAKRVLDIPGIELVIMGHTHEAKDRPNGLAYFNTGCWTRNWEFGDGDSGAWSSLKRANRERFPYELRYVRISGASASKAQLLTYKSERVK